MGELVKKFAEQSKRKSDRPRDDNIPAEEQKALDTLRAEAEDRGATLATGGKGGLPPSLVLGVFRRDKFKCKRCGARGGDEGGLTVHHKAGIVESKWLSKKGHSNDPNNLVILCAECHDEIHEKAREEGIDSSQVTPEGDKGTSRDKGKPTAHPKH